MDRRAASSSLSSMSTVAIVTLMLSLMVVVANAGNFVIDLKHKFEHLSAGAGYMNEKPHGFEIGEDRIGGFGNFYGKVMIGDPAKAYYPLIGSGSDLTWIYCAGCKLCPSGKKSNPFNRTISDYDVKASSKGKIVTCDDPLCLALNGKNSKKLCSTDNVCMYHVSYDNREISNGHLVSDTMQLRPASGNEGKSTPAIDFVFGCGVDQFKGLEDVAFAYDGTFGLARSEVGLISQLASTNQMKKTFAHCLRSNFKGGILALGEVEAAKGIKTIPLMPNEVRLKVKTKSFDIGGKPIDISDVHGAVFDIGTAYNVFPDSVYTAIIDEIKSTHKHMNWSEPIPFFCTQPYNGSVDDDFPTLNYHFEGGLDLIMHPHQYMYEQNHGKWCMAIQNSTRSLNRDFFTIGENTLLEKLVVFDLQKDEMGWIDHDCLPGSI